MADVNNTKKGRFSVIAVNVTGLCVLCKLGTLLVRHEEKMVILHAVSGVRLNASP